MHPCGPIVDSQGLLPGNWQVPEGWAGSLATAKILFLSSNPSISLPPKGEPGRAEDYPTSSWADDDVADFIVNRFDQWVTADDRYLLRDGSYSAPVQFWSRVRRRATEILGRPADPRTDYAMTEVVHCKSRAEQGVTQAVDLCASLHLDRLIAACAAQLIVVLGAKARDQVQHLWGLPREFGRGHRPGLEPDHMVTVEIGGRERMIVHLPHPTGMEPNGNAATAFPTALKELRRWADRDLPPTPSPTPGAGLYRDDIPRSSSTIANTSRSPSVQDKDVVIVAAGNAWPFYRLTGAYVCKAGRTFRGVEHIGFYSQRTIHGAVAKVEHVLDEVVLSQADAARRALSLDPLERRLGDVMTAALAGAWKEGENSKIILLTGLDDQKTIHFEPVNHPGHTAWVMGQRYTRLEALLQATTTDDLIGGPK